MRAITADHLQDRIKVRVDPESDPVDVDAAVAKFLLAYVRQQSRPTPAAPAAEGPAA